MWRKLKFALRVSMNRWWLAIVGPTLVWGSFPLFFAALPDAIVNDLSVLTYGAMMITRGIVGILFFGAIAAFMWLGLGKEKRAFLWRFYLRHWKITCVAALAGVVCVRLFEGFIFQRGEITFALIFCVALTPFTEQLLSAIYSLLYKQLKFRHGICKQLFERCVEWPTPTGKIHTALRLSLLAMVVIFFMYARDGYLLVSPAELSSDPASSARSGYGVNLILAFLSAFSLQFYYHLLEAQGANFQAEWSRQGGEVDGSFAWTKVFLQQVVVWFVGCFGWLVILFGSGLFFHDGYIWGWQRMTNTVGLLCGSTWSILGWFGGVVFLGTIVCYLFDNLGVDLYSDWATKNNRPISASKWAGVATTVDPIISLVLFVFIGEWLNESVAVPNAAFAAALCMSLVFYARFSETAAEVFENVRGRALRARLSHSSEAAEPEEDGVAAGIKLGEFLLVNISDRPEAIDWPRSPEVRIVQKIWLPGNRSKAGDYDSHKGGQWLFNQITSKHGKNMVPAMQMGRVVGLDRILGTPTLDGENLSRMTVAAIRRALGKHVYIADARQQILALGKNENWLREHLKLPLEIDKDDWLFLCFHVPEWEYWQKLLPENVVQRIEKDAKQLERAIAGKLKIWIEGELSESGLLEKVAKIVQPADEDEVDCAVFSADAVLKSKEKLRIERWPAVIVSHRYLSLTEQRGLAGMPYAVLQGEVRERRETLAAALFSMLKRSGILTTRRLHILIVEDNPEEVKPLEEMIANGLGGNCSFDYFTPPSENPDFDMAECVEKLVADVGEQTPDCVLFDYVLSDNYFEKCVDDLTGERLAKELIQKLEHPPVMAMFSSAKLRDISWFRDQGGILMPKNHEELKQRGIPELREALAEKHGFGFYESALSSCLVFRGWTHVIQRLGLAVPMPPDRIEDSVCEVIKQAGLVLDDMSLFQLPEFFKY